MSRPIRNPVVFKSIKTGKKLQIYNIQDYMVCKNKLKCNKKLQSRVLPILPPEIVEYIVYHTNNVALYTNLYGHSVKRLRMLLNNHTLKQYFVEVGADANDAAYDFSSDVLLKTHYNNSSILPYISAMILCENDKAAFDKFMKTVPCRIRECMINECDDIVDAMMRVNFAWWRIMRKIFKLLPTTERVSYFNVYIGCESSKKVEIIDKMFSECQTLNHNSSYFLNKKCDQLLATPITINLDTRYYLFYTHKERVAPHSQSCNIVNEVNASPPMRGFVVVVDELKYDINNDTEYIFTKNDFTKDRQLKFDEHTYNPVNYSKNCKNDDTDDEEDDEEDDDEDDNKENKNMDDDEDSLCEWYM